MTLRDRLPEVRGGRQRVVAFMNAYTEGMSGGDACFIEIAKRLPDGDIAVVSSSLGEEACLSRGLHCQFWITTRERAFGVIVITYILRTLKGIWLTRRVRHGDIIYATSDFLPDVLPAFLSKLRLPACRWVQKSFHIIPASRPVSRWAQRLSHVLIRAKADILIADNSLLRAELAQRGIPRERMQLNYPGIDTAYYQSFPAAGAATRIYDAVYLGRIQASKGIFTLVDIWQLVCRRCPNARLAVIGRGDPRTTEALQKRIAAAGLAENIALLGYLETADAVHVLKQSKVFVSSSPEEGFGMAILEAITVGLPVVAWDLPVYREVFPQGLVGVPLNDSQAFADAVTGLLADPRWAAAIVAEAHDLPARYDWHQVAAREWQLVKDAVVSPEAW